MNLWLQSIILVAESLYSDGEGLINSTLADFTKAGHARREMGIQWMANLRTSLRHGFRRSLQE